MAERAEGPTVKAVHVHPPPITPSLHHHGPPPPTLLLPLPRSLTIEMPLTALVSSCCDAKPTTIVDAPPTVSSGSTLTPSTLSATTPPAAAMTHDAKLCWQGGCLEGVWVCGWMMNEAMMGMTLDVGDGDGCLCRANKWKGGGQSAAQNQEVQTKRSAPRQRQHRALELLRRRLVRRRAARVVLARRRGAAALAAVLAPAAQPEADGDVLHLDERPRGEERADRDV